MLKLTGAKSLSQWSKLRQPHAAHATWRTALDRQPHMVETYPQPQACDSTNTIGQVTTDDQDHLLADRPPATTFAAATADAVDTCC